MPTTVFPGLNAFIPRSGILKWTNTLALAGLILFSSSCGSIVKQYVNKKYPPVSSLDKSTDAVRVSDQELNSLADPDIGIVLSEPLLVNAFREAFHQLYRNDSTLGIPHVSRITVLSEPRYKLGQQEVISSAQLRFFVKDNKYVKQFDIEFTGRAAVSFAADSLVMDPSFQRIHINRIRLRKFILLGGTAKALINQLCRNFMNNLNGQIKSQALKIDYPPLPELPLSKILGDQPNLTVTKDDTFRIRRKILNPVVLIEPKKLSILAKVSDEKIGGETPAAATRVVAPPPPNISTGVTGGTVYTIQGENSISGMKAVRAVTPEEFRILYDNYGSSFYARWTGELDKIEKADTQTQARLSYRFVGKVMDELFQDAAFGLRYQLNETTSFPDKHITLKEIPKPDCEGIHFDCQFNKCSNVLSDCGSCKWYQAGCHVAWLACQTANGVKYAACQTSNAAKAVWCAGELVARKTVCYAEIAGIFLYDNLIKDVGQFGGGATATGPIQIAVNHISPGGIYGLALDGAIDARVNATVNLKFRPAGILGRLICVFPMDETVALNDITISQNYKLNAEMERVMENEDAVLKIKMSKLSLALHLSNPLLVELLKKPALVLNCGIGIIFGTAIGSVLALAGNEDFKNYMSAAMFGRYRVDLQQDFGIRIPSFKLSNQIVQHEFRPNWGEKSIHYQ